ncbi:MAG: hypothetical protein N3D11_08565 [Candidatus Sumerlaeia bacterium]|nr:hypothetical protein [Candidatus Sumerlaeia bacterium]
MLFPALPTGVLYAAPPTSPTASLTPPPRSESTPPPLPIQADLSIFFPPKGREGNAASAYIRAFELYRADRDRTKYTGQWDVLLQRKPMRMALDQITSGALCKRCDFIPFLPDDLSRSTKFPYLVESQVLARLLAQRFERELEAKQTTAALDTARILMAFGRHLRMSAMVLSQDVQGLACERLAVTCFAKAVGPTADADTSAKISVVLRMLDSNQQWIADELLVHRGSAPVGFSADLRWLRSSHPVLRCEAILNMAQETLPPTVLIKPTPVIDIRLLVKKMEEATSPSALRLRPEDVEIKARWPRKGVRADLSARDIQRLREALAPVAANDPDIRPRTLAKRLLDALVDVPAPPKPPKLPDGLSTKPLGILPPPRPPQSPLK